MVANDGIGSTVAIDILVGLLIAGLIIAGSLRVALLASGYRSVHCPAPEHAGSSVVG